MAEGGDDGKEWFHNLLKSSTSEKSCDVILNRLRNGDDRLKFLISYLKFRKIRMDFTPSHMKSDELTKQLRLKADRKCLVTVNKYIILGLYSSSVAHGVPGSLELALTYANRCTVLFRYHLYEECLLDIARALKCNCTEDIRGSLYARRLRCFIRLKCSDKEIAAARECALQQFQKMHPGSPLQLEVNGILFGKDYQDDPPDQVKIPNSENNKQPESKSNQQERVNVGPIEIEIEDPSCEIYDASGIDIQHSQEYGATITATTYIKPGEAIAIIRPYVRKIITRLTYRCCALCDKDAFAAIPCDYCVHAVYCSEDCRDRAWDEYHELECPIIDILEELRIADDYLVFVRGLLKGVKQADGMDNFIAMIEDIECDKDLKVFTVDLDPTNYASVHAAIHSRMQRLKNIAFYQRSIVAIYIVHYLATRTDIFGRRFTSSLQMFDECSAVMSFTRIMMETFGYLKLNRGVMGSLDIRRKSIDILPFTIFMDYSCDPNTVVIGNSRRAVVVAVHPIKTGEVLSRAYQLSWSKPLHFSRNAEALRMEAINRYWHLPCECVACKNRWPTISGLPSLQRNDIIFPTRSRTLEKKTDSPEETYQRTVLIKDETLCPLIEVYYMYAWPTREGVALVEILKLELMALPGLNQDD